MDRHYEDDEGNVIGVSQTYGHSASPQKKGKWRSKKRDSVPNVFHKLFKIPYDKDDQDSDQES